MAVTPPPDACDASGIVLGELLAALSLVADIGSGQPMEHVLRICLIAVRLGDRPFWSMAASIPVRPEGD
jgi:hypothetical protein